MNTQHRVRDENGALGNIYWMGCFAEQMDCYTQHKYYFFQFCVFSYFLCTLLQGLNLDLTNVLIAVATSKLENQGSFLAKFCWERF